MININTIYVTKYFRSHSLYYRYAFTSKKGIIDKLKSKSTLLGFYVTQTGKHRLFFVSIYSFSADTDRVDYDAPFTIKHFVVYLHKQNC